jgi:NADPH:quinone reductase-like Zn-dependent oxidoreductase
MSPRADFGCTPLEAIRPQAPPFIMMPTTEPLALAMGKRRGFHNLSFRMTTRRAPGPGEVELRIQAVSLNFKDALKILGWLSDGVLEDTFFGSAVGMEAAATVVRIGDGVDELKVGDRIIAMPGTGCLATWLTLPVKDMFWGPQFPEYDSRVQAGIPIVFLTALYCLHWMTRLQPGERVLLHSATGGVGLAAIQVARWLGAEIFATAGSPGKRDLLRSIGIRHVMDSRSLDFADEIMAVTGGGGVDVVMNFLPGEALSKSLGILAPFGRFVEIGKRDIEENNALPLRPFNRNLTFSAVDMDRLAKVRPAMMRKLLREVWNGFSAGRFQPVETSIFPLADIGEACRHMMKARHIGKCVLQVEDQSVPVRRMDHADSELAALRTSQSETNAEDLYHAD